MTKSPLSSLRAQKAAFRDAAKKGEGRDDTVAHVASGEIVLPISFQKSNPDLVAVLKHAFEMNGANFDQFVVGGPNRHNQSTGLPMFDDGDGGGNGGGDNGGNGDGLEGGTGAGGDGLGDNGGYGDGLEGGVGSAGGGDNGGGLGGSLGGLEGYGGDFGGLGGGLGGAFGGLEGWGGSLSDSDLGANPETSDLVVDKNDNVLDSRDIYAMNEYIGPNLGKSSDYTGLSSPDREDNPSDPTVSSKGESQVDFSFAPIGDLQFDTSALEAGAKGDQLGSVASAATSDPAMSSDFWSDFSFSPISDLAFAAPTSGVFGAVSEDVDPEDNDMTVSDLAFNPATVTNSPASFTQDKSDVSALADLAFNPATTTDLQLDKEAVDPDAPAPDAKEAEFVAPEAVDFAALQSIIDNVKEAAPEAMNLAKEDAPEDKEAAPEAKEAAFNPELSIHTGKSSATAEEQAELASIADQQIAIDRATAQFGNPAEIGFHDPGAFGINNATAQSALDNVFSATIAGNSLNSGNQFGSPNASVAAEPGLGVEFNPSSSAQAGNYADNAPATGAPTGAQSDQGGKGSTTGGVSDAGFATGSPTGSQATGGLSDLGATSGLASASNDVDEDTAAQGSSGQAPGGSTGPGAAGGAPDGSTTGALDGLAVGSGGSNTANNQPSTAPAPAPKSAVNLLGNATAPVAVAQIASALNQANNTAPAAHPAPATKSVAQMSTPSPLTAIGRAAGIAASRTEKDSPSNFRAIPNATTRDEFNLARAIHAEAANEGRAGKSAVGHVMANRTFSPEFSKNGGITGQIYATAPNGRHEFSFLDPGDRAKGMAARAEQANTASWQESLAVAREIIAGKSADPTRGAMFYRNAGTTSAKGGAFHAGLEKTGSVQIGSHRFSGFADKGGRTIKSDNRSKATGKRSDAGDALDSILDFLGNFNPVGSANAAERDPNASTPSSAWAATMPGFKDALARAEAANAAGGAQVAGYSPTAPAAPAPYFTGQQAPSDPYVGPAGRGPALASSPLPSLLDPDLASPAATPATSNPVTPGKDPRSTAVAPGPIPVAPIPNPIPLPTPRPAWVDKLNRDDPQPLPGVGPVLNGVLSTALGPIATLGNLASWALTGKSIGSNLADHPASVAQQIAISRENELMHGDGSAAPDRLPNRQQSPTDYTTSSGIQIPLPTPSSLGLGSHRTYTAPDDVKKYGFRPEATMFAAKGGLATLKGKRNGR